MTPATRAGEGTGHDDARGALPAPPTEELVGRDADRARIRARLAAGRLVTVTGPGGVGKTRAALAVAIELASTGTATSFVPLADVQPGSTMAALVRVLIGPTAGEDGGIDLLAEVLDRPGHLLVLDTFDRLRGDAHVVASLLDRFPGLRILITSRVRLRLAREAVVVVDELPAPAAATLFARRTEAATGAPVAVPAATVDAICEAVGRSPLAIELAASRLTVLPPAALLRALRQGNGTIAATLGSGAADGHPRHRDLARTIDWTLELLEPTARELLLSLGVCTGPFGMDVVEALCPPQVDRPLDALAELVELHLVATVPDEHVPAGVRYRLLDTIGDHVVARLRADGRLDEARRRRHDLTWSWIDQAGAGLRSTRELRWQQRVDAEQAEVEVLLGHLHDDSDHRRGLAAAVALAPFWAEVGPRDEGRRWLGRFLAGAAGDAARDLDPLHLHARAWEGHLAAEAGDPAGLARLQAAVTGLRAGTVDPRTELAATDLLVRSLTAAGELAEADAEARRCEQVCRRLGLDDLLVPVLYRRAFIARQLGARERALDLARESRDLAGRIGHAGFLARSEAFIGHQSGSWLGPSDTLPLIEEAARRNLSARQWSAAAWAMVDAGAAASAAGADDVALSWATQALDVAVRIDHWQAQVCSAALVVGVAIEHSAHDPALRLHGALGPHLAAFAPGLVPPAYRLSYEALVEEAVDVVGPDRARALQAAHPAGWDEVLVEVRRLAESLAADRQHEADIPGGSGAAAVNGAMLVAGQVEPLTRRELDVLVALVGGGTNREIAAELFISAKTVMHHAASIYRKLGVRNRAEAVVCALRAGAVPITRGSGQD